MGTKTQNVRDEDAGPATEMARNITCFHRYGHERAGCVGYMVDLKKPV